MAHLLRSSPRGRGQQPGQTAKDQRRIGSGVNVTLATVAVVCVVGQDVAVWATHAVAAARAVVAGQGLEAGDGEVVRVGTNAVVRFVAAGVLAKVTEGPESVGQVERELAMARWFASLALPAVLPVVREPVVIDSCVVSLWEYLPGARSADVVTLRGACVGYMRCLCRASRRRGRWSRWPASMS